MSSQIILHAKIHTATPIAMKRIAYTLSQERVAELFASLTNEDDINAHHAFREIFDIYVHDLTRFAGRIVGSTDTAQDIVQDVFIRIWHRRRDLQCADFVAYLFRAVRNTALKVIDHNTVVERWAVSVHLEASKYESSETNHGERALEVTDLSEQLSLALSKLTPRAREVVQLCHQEGLKPGQVAEVLGIAPATVYSMLSRALKQLAEELKPIQP